MIKDAEKNREADAKRAEEISTIIQAENLVNSLRKRNERRQHCDSWRRKNKNCWVHKGMLKNLITTTKMLNNCKKKIDELNVLLTIWLRVSKQD